VRVTHVITRLIIGGAQENTLASVFGLSQKPGLQLSLVSGPTTGPEGTLEPLAARVPGLLTVIPELVRPVNPWKDVIAMFRLAAHFRRTGPEIVHTHSGKAGVLGRLAAAQAKVPVVVHTIHGPSFGPFQSAPANLLFRTAEKVAARYTSHFVVVADAMRDQYLASGIGTPERYSRIYSGFDLAPFASVTNEQALRAELGLAAGDFVVGTIARLFELKGHDDLLEIAPRLAERVPEIKFLLVGDGPWRVRLAEKARKLGVSRRFVFAGLVPPERVPGMVAVMDLLVHLSRREGLPRAIPQALAAGRPAIAYDCDGAREVCIDGHTGYLVKPGDLDTLSEKVIVLARNTELRQTMGLAGREFVRARFSVEAMVDALHELYVKLRNTGSQNAAGQ
jgi:glycosyltransferase involved in cell wall biosynthesis